MQRGKFITIEGIEGVGKSTNIDLLASLIEQHGHRVLKTREPGGTPIAENIRRILKEHGDEPLPDVAEMLLLFAARSINVNNAIRPALESGTWVIADRFTDSTRAYQGGGRGFPRESIEWLAEFVHGDLQPDLTILLDAPVDTAMQRAGRRGDLDRFEVEQGISSIACAKLTCNSPRASPGASPSWTVPRTSLPCRRSSAKSRPRCWIINDIN